MASCLIRNGQYMKYLGDSSSRMRNCQYVVFDADEWRSIMKLTTATTTNPIDEPAVSNGLHIDANLYGTVTGYLLLSFLTGHFLGRIVKTMNKV